MKSMTLAAAAFAFGAVAAFVPTHVAANDFQTSAPAAHPSAQTGSGNRHSWLPQTPTLAETSTCSAGKPASHWLSPAPACGPAALAERAASVVVRQDAAASGLGVAAQAWVQRPDASVAGRL